MEMRLKGQGPNSGSGPSTSTSASAKANNPNAPPPPPAKDHPADQNRAREQQQKYAGSRPGTARQGQPAVPGALPPTPAGSEGEFEPSVVCPSRIAPRPPGTQAQSRLGAPKPSAGVYPSARANDLPVPGGDADSVKSLSDSASFADYVIVPEPDGDRERDA